MKNRNVVSVILLPMVTLGISLIFWYKNTKDEMNNMGAKIPSLIMLFIPIANIFFLLSYAEGVEMATRGKMTKMTAFLLIFLLGSIGCAIIQNEFNQIGIVPIAATQPAMPTDTMTTTPVVGSEAFATAAPIVAAETFNQSPSPVEEVPTVMPNQYSSEGIIPTVAESNSFQDSQQPQVSVDSFEQPQQMASSEQVSATSSDSENQA